MPGEQAGQDAAQKHADRAAARHHEAEDAHRLGPLAGVGEEAHDQGQRHCGDRGAAEALDRAAHDQEPRRRGEGTGDRGDGEGRHAAEQHPAVAVEVAEASGQQQEAAEGEHVGVDDPRQRLRGERQVGLDRGEGDVDDVRVEHDHQVAQAQGVEGQPAGPAVVHRKLLGVVREVVSSPPRTRYVRSDRSFETSGGSCVRRSDPRHPRNSSLGSPRLDQPCPVSGRVTPGSARRRC